MKICIGEVSAFWLGLVDVPECLHLVNDVLGDIRFALELELSLGAVLAQDGDLVGFRSESGAPRFSRS